MSRSRDIADFVAEITDGTDTVETGYVINGSAKSFINHNAGTTINGSFNVSSLTDNTTGDHSHSFTSNHSDIYYAATGSIISDSTVQTNTSTHSCVTAGNTPSECAHSVSTIRCKTMHMNNVANDHQMVQVVTHGDLA